MDASEIVRFPGLDLAVIPFNSDRDYPVAAIGNSDRVNLKEKIYTVGWSRSGGSLRQPVFVQTEGVQ